MTLDTLLPAIDAPSSPKFRELAHDLADLPMLSRTHSQPASPTTLGRGDGQHLRARTVPGPCPHRRCRAGHKFNSAVERYNATCRLTVSGGEEEEEEGTVSLPVSSSRSRLGSRPYTASRAPRRDGRNCFSTSPVPTPG